MHVRASIPGAQTRIRRASSAPSDRRARVAVAGRAAAAPIFSRRVPQQQGSLNFLKLISGFNYNYKNIFFYCTAQTDLSSGKPFLGFTCSQFLAAAGNDGPCIYILYA